jgi:hypothetical protein
MNAQPPTSPDNDRQGVASRSLSGLPAGLASKGSHFLDLYGEGLSGVLSEVGRGWYYKRNIGGGKLTPPVALQTRENGQLIGKSDGPLQSGYNNRPTK